MPGPLLARTPVAQRRSGTLAIFLSENADPAAPPYARFRVCRGFIDDLHRMLPIRARIDLEAAISAGRNGGEFSTPHARFRWEFRPD